MPTYVIEHRNQECDCDYCGMPLYIGDTVHTEDVESIPHVFCCQRHQIEFEDMERRRTE